MTNDATHERNWLDIARFVLTLKVITNPPVETTFWLQA